MSAELDDAVARLKQLSKESVGRRMAGVFLEQADRFQEQLRILLADWERLRRHHGAWVSSEAHRKVVLERDAARAEVKALRESMEFHLLDKCGQEMDRMRAEVERLSENLKSARATEIRLEGIVSVDGAAQSRYTTLLLETERTLHRERTEWMSVVDACAQVGIAFSMREPTPEHPVGVEVRNEAAAELTRLRERDARVRYRIELARNVPSLSPTARVDLDEVLALLKETP